MDTNTEAATSALSPAEKARLRRAFSHMPYGAMVNYARIETVEDVAVALDGLASVLRGVAERAHATEKALRTLEDQRDAMRAFLGTDVCLDHDRPRPCLECQ